MDDWQMKTSWTGMTQSFFFQSAALYYFALCVDLARGNTLLRVFYFYIRRFGQK